MNEAYTFLGYLTKKSDVFSYETALNKTCFQSNAVSPKHFSLKAAAQKKIKYTLVKIFMELHLVVQLVGEDPRCKPERFCSKQLLRAVPDSTTQLWFS